MTSDLLFSHRMAVFNSQPWNDQGSKVFESLLNHHTAD